MNSGTSVVLDYPGKLYYTNKTKKKDYANLIDPILRLLADGGAFPLCRSPVALDLVKGRERLILEHVWLTNGGD